MKRVVFLGSSRDDLRSFPEAARHEAGVQLGRIQRGLDPADWKPLKAAGQGVREIRVRDIAGAFRVIYVIALGDDIFVLHAFQKKTQKTEKRDLDLATKRFRELKQRIER